VARLVDLLAQRSVLEIACGTGYWTQFHAEKAKAVTATDFNEAVLSIARARLQDRGNVQVRQADAFSLKNPGPAFDAGFAGFWWSHVERQRMDAFLDGLHACLLPGSRVVFADNLYVEGNSTPVSRTDGDGNTYQIRRLADGRRFEVLKNFPTRAEFEHVAGRFGGEVHFEASAYFWCGWYDLPD